MLKTLAVSALMAFFALGCMASPRNGQTLTTLQDNVVFSGALPNPGVEVTVSYVNLSGNPIGTVGQFTTSSQAEPLAGGWYPWVGTTKLNDYSKWQVIPNQRRLYVRLKAHVPGQEGGTSELAAFNDSDYLNCKEGAEDGGPGAIINQCKAESPIIVLYTDCGGAGQTCCKASLNVPACDEGLTCNESTNTCGGTIQMQQVNVMEYQGLLVNGENVQFDDSLLAGHKLGIMPPPEELFGHKLGL